MNQLPQKLEKTNGSHAVGCRRARTQLIFLGLSEVWEADPLICPTCQREMRIVSLIDERDVIEKMLKCLGLWQQGIRVVPQQQSGTDPPGGDWVYEPVDQDPFPACHAETPRRRDYDSEPVLFHANA